LIQLSVLRSIRRRLLVLSACEADRLVRDSDRLSLDSVEIQNWALARAQLDALLHAQKAFGELEDAVQRPLDPTEVFVITPESPVLRAPAKQ
jgi:hypothetical protein